MDTPESKPAHWLTEKFQVHEPALRSYLRGHFPSLFDVDDIVQESFVRLLWTKAARKVGHPKAYLFATARNAALDLFRRQRIISIESRDDLERLPVIDDRPGVAETLCRAQDLELLDEAIESLPKRCRTILKLRKIYGLSHKAIADQLGISENTVNAQVANGVRRCTVFLRARREGGPP